jgi:3-hydroxyacyl-CoA dehydrogenase/3a,7a,12a-trihydroxy-5b-cholest-24-enoyl-CoA hydratase
MSAEDIFKQMTERLEKLPEAKRNELVKSSNAIFVFDISDKSVKHTLNLKEGKGSSASGIIGKPDITIITNEDTFAKLVQGKLNGQKAFSSGKLKIKGNMMLAMKLDKVLAALAPPKTKL